MHLSILLHITLVFKLQSEFASNSLFFNILGVTFEPLWWHQRDKHTALQLIHLGLFISVNAPSVIYLNNKTDPNYLEQKEKLLAFVT